MYTSEDAAARSGPQLSSWFCTSSGEHLLITDAELSDLPRRRTDGALVLDTQACVARLRAEQQPAKLVQREDGFERQYRYSTATDLLFAYRTEPGGRLLYILPNALTSFARSDDAGRSEAAPVPPCIHQQRRGDGGEPCVRVTLSLEERAKSAGLVRIAADDVLASVTCGAASCAGELLEVFAAALGVRQSALQVVKGVSDASRLDLLVLGLNKEDVFQRLGAAVQEANQRARK